jgi:predicted extracellular nuclease
VALQEIQDDDGTGTTTLSAELTYARLTDAVVRQGGPRYGFAEVRPEGADADGGEPNGNIRVGFLYRLDRVTLTPRGDGSSARATELEMRDGRVLLTQNPGRIAPQDAAWIGQRKPLVAELVVLDTRIFFVNVHFISRLGDDPPFGATQPPAEPSALRRNAQARVVAAFIERLLTLDPAARVVVLGDFNDTEDSETLGIVERAGAENLTLREPLAERYTYNHLGTSEALDHVLVSPSLSAGADIDTIRLGADFAHALRTTDHDAVVVRLSVR